MRSFINKLFSVYFRPFLTIVIVFNIFCFIYFIMRAELSESAKRFGDVILGVLLSKLGTAVDFWLGNTDREQSNITDNEKNH